MAVRATAEGRLQRILAMVPWVVAHDGPTVVDVCARFGCTPTELASDIELLYLCGLYPYTPDLLIEAAIVDGRVFIEYADYFSRPLRLTPAEGLSLVAAASTLLAAPGTDAQGPLARGLAKLANAIGGAADAVEIELGAAEAETLRALRDASAAGTQVVIDYYAFGRDERATRTIEPAGVFSTGGQWYVSAYCHLARDERLFRVDRIVALTPTDLARSGPAVSPAPGLFARRPGGGSVTLVLEPSMQWVAEQYPVEATDVGADGRVRVRLAVAEWAWLDRLVLRLGAGAQIEDPPPGWPGRADAAVRVLSRYAEAGVAPARGSGR
jgi:proteasome accessory factor C